MRKLRRLFIGLTSFIVAYYLTTGINYSIDVSSAVFTHADKCPACYGVKLCQEFHYKHLQLYFWSRVRIFQIFNEKNVHYGQLDGNEVVVKKLAHYGELRKADALLCQHTRQSDLCDVREAVMTLVAEVVSQEKTLSFANHTASFFPTDLFRCPSERLMTYMFDRCLSKEAAAGNGYHVGDTKAYVLYTALVNPEPLILQMFPASQSWPFPRYHGSCGRAAVVEYAGPTLSDFVDSPWYKRVDIAIQLLKIAQQLTENALDFALYMTDVNLHNFAIDDNGIVRLVDVENIVIVDRKKIRRDKPAGWDEPHTNFGIGCKNCLSFSVDELCSHELADHNYYAICRGILAPKSYYLSKGLLHNAPILRGTTQVADLVQRCARPTTETERLEIIPKLIDLLEYLASQ